jgi:hypothetical protein
LLSAHLCSQECEHGTHECVRYNPRQRTTGSSTFDGYLRERYTRCSAF